MDRSILFTGLVSILLFAHSSYRFQDIEPYMDEIFHIPQCQRYCIGDMSWDPKITTFPGLYHISVLIHYSTKFYFESSCTISELRAHNILFVLIIYACSSYIHKKVLSKHDAHAIGLFVSTIPTNAFYYFLYYTDSASTAFLLLSYTITLSHQRERKISSFNGLYRGIVLLLMASMAIYIRQTNVVWLLYLIGITTLYEAETTGSFRDRYPISFQDGWKQIYDFISILIKKTFNLILKTLPLLLPILYFITFIVKNGSIVLGDKENHKPSLHFAMPLHMLFYTSIYVHGIIFLQILSNTIQFNESILSVWYRLYGDFTKLFLSSITVIIWHILGIFCTIIILRYGVQSHPFLLADNRHYTFYIWNRFLQYPFYRSLLGIIYYPSIYLMIKDLLLDKGLIWILIFLTAASLSLIPSHLLEFRYFTPGMMIILVNYPFKINYKYKNSEISLQVSKKVDALNSSCIDGLIMGTWLLLIANMILLYIFIDHPYRWVDGTIARFMF